MQLDLMVGRRKTGVCVRPDAKYPDMWRVYQGDQVSDMVNLTRAKDAAVRWATPERGGFSQSEVLSWHTRET